MVDVMSQPPSAEPVPDPPGEDPVPTGADPAPVPAPEAETTIVRRPPPRRRGRYAAPVFGVLTLVALVGAAFLVREGYRTAREITGGIDVDTQIAADAPGYIATVSPTPVRVLVLSNAEGAVDFLVVAESPGGSGARLMWVVGDMIVDRESGPMSLEGIADLEGVDVAVTQIEELLGLGIEDTTVLDPETTAELFGLVGPLAIDNPDTLSFPREGTSNVVYRAGDIELEPTEINDFLLQTANRETPTNRSIRASLVFEEYFTQLANAEALPTSTVRSDSGDDVAARFGELAQGVVSFELLGVGDEAYGDAVLYYPDPERIAEQVADAVAFPVSAFPGQRPRVYVLNGTSDVTVAASVAHEVAAAGAEVVAIGNAPTFGTTATVVEYHSPESAEAAARIAEVFGVDPLLSAQQTDARDITVTLGLDAADR